MYKPLFCIRPWIKFMVYPCKYGIRIHLWCHKGTSGIWVSRLWCCYDRVGIWSLKGQICRSTYTDRPLSVTSPVVLSPIERGNRSEFAINTCRVSWRTQVWLSVGWDQCGSSSNNIRSCSDHRAQEASDSTEVKWLFAILVDVEYLFILQFQ